MGICNGAAKVSGTLAPICVGLLFALFDGGVEAPIVFCGVLMFLCAIASALLHIETRGLTLDEIQGGGEESSLDLTLSSSAV